MRKMNNEGNVWYLNSQAEAWHVARGWDLSLALDCVDRPLYFVTCYALLGLDSMVLTEEALNYVRSRLNEDRTCEARPIGTAEAALLCSFPVTLEDVVHLVGA